MRIQVAAAIALAASLASGSALASDYYLATATKEAVHFVDMATIKTDASGRKSVWQLRVYKKNQANGVDYTRDLGTFDCGASTFQFKSSVHYAADGDVVQSYEPTQLIDIPPDTVLDAIAKLVCAPKPDAKWHLGERTINALIELSRAPIAGD
jgi:hypothetical protein